uniref:SAM-dependent methyltransferase n=1 Tax=Solibacter usitatus (strain Ellin6076) TaxID=234267 RepID=Q01NL6_SOLUE
MTAAGELLAAEIRAVGPVSFRRFMEVALYHPEHGYYRRAADPFGKEGDFFTAEQIQPVFGILMAARIRALFREMGSPPGFSVVELGAGRREMAEAFAEWNYVPVDLATGEMPERFTGVLFSNEFFDALPVDAVIYMGEAFHLQHVTVEDGVFRWQTGEAVSEEADEYLRRYYLEPEEGRWYEVNLEALRWLERISASLTKGYVLTIDYGYTRAESVRFEAGTLMGYRRHTALDDVLTDPGVRDITSHVNFTALEERGAECGLVKERFETLAQSLLAAGEPDQFTAALGTPGTHEELRRRMQLKTLLFGMGETFRVLLQSKVEGERESERKG